MYGMYHMLLTLCTIVDTVVNAALFNIGLVTGFDLQYAMTK